MRPSNIEKYLSRYAEPEVSKVEVLLPALSRHYKNTVVIPAFDESSQFIQRLNQHPNISNTLVIIVINQPEDTDLNPNNDHLFNHLVNDATLQSHHHNLFFIQTDCFDAVVIDRFSSGQQIPIKQGVGLARKTGSDVACKIIHDSNLNIPWIYSTDADAHLPENYFSLKTTANPAPNLPRQKQEFSACVFDFTHRKNSSCESQATLLYEQGLKYYRNGLFWAGSPYAFYTLGSTLAFTPEAYCKVRGFPKKPGAEDFYLLNKLAKVGAIQYAPEIIVSLDSRASERIPFGTGPAVKNIMKLTESNEEYRYYSPQVFGALKNWLTWATQDLAGFACQNNDLNAVWRPIAQDSLAPEIIAAIESIQFDKFISHAFVQCKTPEMFLSHFHEWFDGFKTLKFIHFLQNHYFPAQKITQCLSAQTHWTQ